MYQRVWMIGWMVERAEGAWTWGQHDAMALVVFPVEVTERAVLEKIRAFARAGGRVILIGEASMRDVDGAAWETDVVRTAGTVAADRVEPVGGQVAGLKGVDGTRDGVWTTRRGSE